MNDESFGSVRWAALCAALAVAACGGRTVGADSRGDHPPSTPDIPSFPDLCSRYQIRHAGGGCGASCPYVTCPCGPVLQVCSPALGCLTSVDCDAVCAAQQVGSLPSATDCIGYSTCNGDADCGGEACVLLPGAAQGACSLAFSPYCLDDGDCAPGSRCVAVTADGVRQCSTGASDTACNGPAQCEAGLACALPDGSFLGACTAGENLAVCARDADCAPGLRCFPYEPMSSSFPNRCSDGSDQAPCAHDADCRQGKCILFRCSAGRAYDGCVADADCLPGLSCVQLYCRDGTHRALGRHQLEGRVG